jgi:hypothetical protein
MALIMNRYLAQLVKVLPDSSGAPASIEWRNELENPPSVSLLNSTEPLPVSPDSPEKPFFDHEYNKSFSSVLSGFGAAAKVLYILSVNYFVA